MVYVLSGGETLVEQVRAALKTSVFRVQNPTMFLELAGARPRRKRSCVIVDLSALPDPREFIRAAKRLPAIAQMPLILFGADQEHERLPDEVRSAANALLVTPVSA